jgi:leader peptidase (prepilin peptidase) / N-methyltransferase
VTGLLAVGVVLPALAAVPALRHVVATVGPADPADPPPRRGVPALPTLALVTAGILAAQAVALRAHPWWLPAYTYLGLVGVALIVIDLRVHRLPDLLTLPSYPVLAALFGVAALDGGTHRWLRAAAAGAVVWALFAACASLPGEGLGYGDVKVSGLLGGALGWLGWGAVFAGFAAGAVLAGITAAVLLVTGRAGRRTHIAFGPFLFAGLFLEILAAHPS